MKTTAYWLTICAAALAVAALWSYNSEKAHADALRYMAAGAGDTEAVTTIIDNSRYPDVLAVIQCKGSDINDMINACGAALRELCPDGGTIKQARESAVGVLPAQVELLVECRHEAAGA